MDEKEFRILQEKVNDDVNIDKNNVLNKSLIVPKLYSYYSQIFSEQLKIFRNMSLEKEKVYGQLYHYYKHEYQFKLDKRTDIEPYIFKDDKWCSLMKNFNDQEVIVKYLEKVLDAVKSMGFSIKNYVDYRKFLEGGI